MRLRFALTLEVALAAPITVQAGPACTVLGQMAVSTWLEMLRGLSTQDAAVLDPVVTRLDHLSSSYAALGCDQALLQSTMDCLMTNADQATDARYLARKCMADTGLQAAN